jgi:hypothetical protein
MIVEDQLDRRVGRIGGIEKLEKFDDFAAAMAILDERMNLAGHEIDAGQQADRAVTLVFMVARETWVHAWPRPQVLSGGRDRLNTGLLVIGENHY